MENRAPDGCKGNSMEALWARLKAGWLPLNGALNARRREILETCIRAGKRCALGLYALTAPAG